MEKEGLCASIYTQPFDVESEQNGLITYDRDVAKLPLYIIRQINSKIWPTTENAKLSAVDIKIVSARPNKSNQQKVADYKAGRNDSLSLRDLAISALSNKDKAFAMQASRAYITSLKDPLSNMNLPFIRSFTLNSFDPGFYIIQSNLQKVDSVLGENEAENLIMNIIYKEEIAPYEKKDSINWDQIEKKVIKKYGELGEERVWGSMLVHYSKISDWENFIKYYRLYFNRIIPLKRSFVQINNISWLLLENVSDSVTIETAIAATKLCIDYYQPNDPNAIDTHANLLYKIGRREEAIRWEQKAVELSNQEAVFVETLDKMKKNVQIWN